MDYEHFLSKSAALLGGRAALATLLGVGPSALSNYAKRGDMPAGRRTALDKALRQEGYIWNEARQDFEPLTASTGQIKQGQTKPICLLIITGGIAAYKSLELARRLMDEGYQVRGVMTQSAQEFITPLSLAALTAERVYTELFSLTDEQEMGHIRLAREADLVLVAPATGNFIAKIATGLADDLASTLCLASDAPLYFAPAMNPVMWAQPATQENCQKLRMRGAIQIGPATGDTACGEVGEGRFAAVPDIIASLPAMGDDLRANRPLSGRSILITAGPTREPIDGVRYISNHSSGKQGYAIAAACIAAGATVTLISGPTELPTPKGVDFIPVQTAKEMHKAAHDHATSTPFDCAICTAAVADWHIVGASHSKMKKTDHSAPPVLELKENPDILKSLCEMAQRPSLVIGFAAETENLIPAAIAKRQRKGCDWIIANQVNPTNSVFGSDHNDIILIREGEETKWPQTSKMAIAERLATEIATHLSHHQEEACYYVTPKD